MFGGPPPAGPGGFPLQGAPGGPIQAAGFSPARGFLGTGFGSAGGPRGACPNCNENAAALRADLDTLQRERNELFTQSQQLYQANQMHQQQLQVQAEQLRNAEAQHFELMQLREAQQRLGQDGQDQARLLSEYQASVSRAEAQRQELAEKVRVAERERDEYYDEVQRMRGDLGRASQDRGDEASLRRQHAREMEDVREEAAKHHTENHKLKVDLQKLQDVVSRLEVDNSQLRDRAEDIEQDIGGAEADFAETQALNGHLQRRIDEMEVQIAAQSQYESEFDKRVTKMLDERDSALAEAARDKEAMLLKVRELQEELGISRRASGGEVADATELALLLKGKQLEVEDLEDRIEELEEELGRMKEGLAAASPGGPRGVAGDRLAIAGTSGLSDQQYEQRMAALKTDALDKDTRLLDAEKKLEELARGMGAEGILSQNRQLMREVENMKRQVGEAKRDLSVYLTEAASIVYENDLLRSIANVKPEQLNLQAYKLKEKVTSAKAVAAQRQLEREVAELEEERSKLKARVRQMSELAAEKVSLLHDLQPEQMLQLEEIAASMRKGRLELPMTDESRKLKEEKNELKKRLDEKDREIADHVDKKVEELLQRHGSAKDLEAKLVNLEKENSALRETLEEVRRNQTEQLAAAASQQAEALALQVQEHGASPELLDSLNQSRLLQAQLQAQVGQLGPGMPPTPAGGAAARQQLLNISNLGASLLQTPGARSIGMLGGGGGGLGGFSSGFGMPSVLPKIPGMQPTAWSQMLQAAVQLPRELADGSPETACSLYCQVIEAVEELAREREVRSGLAEEVQVFNQKFDLLLAEQEVLYKDYFRQRDAWLGEKRSLDERLRLQNDMLNDNQRKLEVQEEQTKQLQRMVAGPGSGQDREELVSAMARVAALEQNESVLARKYEAAQQDHSLVKAAFDNLERDFCERERFLKERLSKAILWKRRSANALRIARRRIQSMVAGADFERAQQELQVSRQRELDLSRRLTELSLSIAHKEDRLREMVDLQERCTSLDNLVRETEQEFTVLRRRLQVREPRFAAECALFARLTAELQRALGFVGHFEAAARAIAASEVEAPGSRSALLGAGSDEASGPPLSVEASLDEKLRKLDANNDGFILLGELRSFFVSLGASVSDEDMRLLADALHPTSSYALASAPPPPPPPGGGGAPPPPPPAPPGFAAAEAETLARASVSVLGVVGRFRLFGLRNLEPEELFWTAVQAQLLRRPDQPDAQKVLHTSFQLLRTQEGYIAAQDVLRVLGHYEVPAERLSARSLRKVLGWLGADARSLEQEAPAATMPAPGDPREPEVRVKLFKLRLVYHDFAERFERCTARALLQLRPPEAAGFALSAEPQADASDQVKCQVAVARESAANRRCVVLEQDVRTKARTTRELQRQVQELENLAERLETELHEERGGRVTLQAQLDSTLPKAEVEPKLKQLEELRFEVQQSRLALQQAKDLARVCSSQAESYEQLVKRRQQEVRHLQESVRLLQATDEVSNTVGKLQYRLLLSQWERGNAQRNLQAVTQDLRAARRELMEGEDTAEQERKEHENEEESLQQRLASSREDTARFKERATASLPIDKARELTSRVEEIASRKSELEEKLADVRRQLHRNQTETEECKMRAQQAQELMVEMKGMDGDSEAPRQRLLEMARKLSDAKLLELRHKRDLELTKEQHAQLAQARQSDEKEIEKLQKEVAEAELRLADQEERWRHKILEAQGMTSSNVMPPGGTPGAPEAGFSTGIRRASKGTIENMEQLQERVMDRNAKVNELELELERAKTEREHTIAEERMKVRKLELELSLMNQGDMVKLRQAMRAEHDAEIRQISDAAQESVHTLQSLLDQAEISVQQRDGEVQQLLQVKNQAAERYGEDTLQLQQEISQLRQELMKVRHMQHDVADTGMRMSPLGGASIDLNESLRLGESMSMEGGALAFGSVEARLEDQRQQVLLLHSRLETQQDEFQSLLDQQFWEAQQREDKLHQDYKASMDRLYEEYKAREERILEEYGVRRDGRNKELQALQNELAVGRTSWEAGSGEANERIRSQAEQAQGYANMAQQHSAVAEQNRISAEGWRGEAERLQSELEAERESYKDSSQKRQQAALRRQLAGKEVQLNSLKKAVEELKERVVELSVHRERDEQECGAARRGESDMRRRVGSQEDRMQGLRDQVARLTRQLQERHSQAGHEKARSADQESREQELEQLLDEASSRLGQQQAEARRLEDELQRTQRRAEESEETLAVEQKVQVGEAKLAKREAKDAAEASARRVAALRERIEVLEAERNEMGAKIGGLEAAAAVLRAGDGGSSSDPQAAFAEAKERLRRETDLRLALQEEVRELSIQLELAYSERLDPQGLGLGDSQQILRQSQPRLPISPRRSPSPSASPVPTGGRTGSRSPAPRSLRQAGELAARCGQLQAELAAVRARADFLGQENDDLKLRLAAGDRLGEPSVTEVDVLRSSLESLGAQNRSLAALVEAERYRSGTLRAGHAEPDTAALRSLREQLVQIQQQLGAERQRNSLLFQALEVERRVSGGTSSSQGGESVALSTARATIANLQGRMDELIRENVQLMRQGPGGPGPGTAQPSSNQIEELTRENVELRRALQGSSSGASAQKLFELQKSIEELTQENLNLRRQAPSAGGGAASANTQMHAAVEQLTRENVELRRSSASATFAAAAGAGQQVEDLRRSMEDLTRENVELRRSQPQTGQNELYQRRIEELTRENVDLMRRNASAGGGGASSADAFALAAAQQQVFELQQRMEELLRENLQLQRAAAPPPPPPPPPGGGEYSALAASQHVVQLQARMEELLRENVMLQRGAGAFAGAAGDPGAMLAAKRQNQELQDKMADLLRENVDLQRSLSAAMATPPPLRQGALGLGCPGSVEDLASLQQLHGEVQSQRRVISLLLAQAASPEASAGVGAAGLAAFELLAEECQRLAQRVTALGDETAILRSRSPQANAGGSAGGLPAMIPPIPGSLAEAHEANALLRARFDELSAEQSLSVVWKQEAAKRIGVLAAEVEELRGRLARSSGSGAQPPAVAEQPAPGALEKSERSRAALEKLLSAQTARVAELSADLEEMEERLRELALGARGVVAPGGSPGASQGVVRERLRLEHQEKLSVGMRHAQGEAAAATEERDHLRNDNETLKGQVQRLLAQQAEQSREAQELRQLAHVGPPAMPGMEEVANRLAKRNEELAEENARLTKAIEQSLPERRQSALEAAKRTLEESGVTLLQMLKALDVQRCGRLSLRTIEAVLKKLPLQLPADSGSLATTVWETAGKFKAADGNISYVDWVAHLTTLPGALTHPGGDKDLSMGVIDGLQRLRGFSLRTALETLDEDGDGILSISTIRNSFHAFFEFLTPEELQLLLELFQPSDDQGHVELMDCVWQLDMAFSSSKGQIDALQAKRRHAQGLVRRQPPLPGAPSWNPLQGLRELVERREASGEKAALRRLVDLFDPDRSGMVTKPMFKAIIRDEVGGNQIDDEQLDYVFEALDNDADGAIVFHEFERAVLGEDHQRRLNDILLRLSQALSDAGMRLQDLARMFGTEAGELEPELLSQMFLRINHRMSDRDLAMLLGELDVTGAGVLCLAELEFRLEAARVEDILGECKAGMAKFGSQLLEAFVAADTERCGRVSYLQLEGLLLGSLRLDLPRQRVRELFTLFNADEGGKISYKELLHRCGLRCTPGDRVAKECLPGGDGPRWGEAALAAVKRALLRSKSDSEPLAQAARNLLTEHDERGVGLLTAAQLRRALVSIGLDVGQREAERLCDVLRPGPREALVGQRGARLGGPRGAQQGQQKGGLRAERELRVDALVARLEAIHVPEEDTVAQRLQARPAAQALKTALQRQGLSITALLADLDPGQHGKVVFDAFCLALKRHRLGLEAQDLTKLLSALGVDGRGLFLTEDLLRLLAQADEAAAASSEARDGPLAPTPYVHGGEALDGLPPPQRRGRSAGAQAVGASGQGRPAVLAGAVEARHRKQFEHLQSALLKSEEEKAKLQKDLDGLKHEVSLLSEEHNRPRPLNVLLSAGDGAPPIVKELKLEVRGTRELRDRLFETEAELEKYRRRLEVDVRQDLDRERHTSDALRKELEEKERTVEELLFDLRRARGAALEGEWAQKEEELMSMNLHNRKLEEELVSRKRSEQDIADRLLEQEHQVMEFRFEREQGQTRCSRLERRILELELLIDGGAPPSRPPPGTASGAGLSSSAAAAATIAGRKDRNYEHVIEGLERVISQQKTDLNRLRQEADRRDDRKQRAEVEKLRKRVAELEGEVGRAKGPRRSQAAEDPRRPRPGGSCLTASEAQSELEVKEHRIAELEERLQTLEASEPPAAAFLAEGPGPELLLLQEELQSLRLARSADAQALDEAQKALQDAERTEQRYLEVAMENRKLRADLGALEDEGFWQEIQMLHDRNEEAVRLARESKEVIERLTTSSPEPPTTLLAQLDHFTST